MELKNLIIHLEEEKFTRENYRRQLEYLQPIEKMFQKVFVLNEDNSRELFVMPDLMESICLTSSPEMACQMQGLGIAVLGFQAEADEMLQASYVVLGLEQVTYQDFLRVFQRKHGIPWKILETERTLVREFSMEDMDALYELYQKPHVTDFIEPLYEYRKEMEYEKEYIERIYGFYGFGMWLVFSKDTGELLGRAGLEYREPCEEGEVELGYVIAPEYWRQGYGTEVCQAVIRYAKGELGMDRISCRVHDNNQPSRRFLEKMGFVGEPVEGMWIFHYNL